MAAEREAAEREATEKEVAAKEAREAANARVVARLAAGEERLRALAARGSQPAAWRVAATEEMEEAAVARRAAHRGWDLVAGVRAAAERATAERAAVEAAAARRLEDAAAEAEWARQQVARRSKANQLAVSARAAESNRQTMERAVDTLYTWEVRLRAGHEGLGWPKDPGRCSSHAAPMQLPCGPYLCASVSCACLVSHLLCMSLWQEEREAQVRRQAKVEAEVAAAMERRKEILDELSEYLAEGVEEDAERAEMRRRAIEAETLAAAATVCEQRESRGELPDGTQDDDAALLLAPLVDP